MVADGFQTEGMHPPYVLAFKNQILCQGQDGHLAKDLVLVVVIENIIVTTGFHTYAAWSDLSLLPLPDLL